MGRASQRPFAWSALTPAESSRAKSPPICRSSSRRNSSWSSTSRQPSHSAHRAANNPRPRRRGHRMNRACAALIVWFCAAVSALAQDSTQPPLVGVLRIDTPATLGLSSGLLREALAALGYVDGRTIRLDFRLAEGDVGRFPEMAVALVRDQASVIVAQGEAAARAAQAATRTIPILASTNDLVASGLIASLAKPGGNVTGISLMVTELDAKRLEVLTELAPPGRRFGVPNDPAISQPAGLQALAGIARARGVELMTVEVHGPQELAPAFASL